eukprot:scaffold253387_cov20-Prasinocladus_malaysianus.AAC.2
MQPSHHDSVRCRVRGHPAEVSEFERLPHNGLLRRLINLSRASRTRIRTSVHEGLEWQPAHCLPHCLLATRQQPGRKCWGLIVVGGRVAAGFPPRRPLSVNSRPVTRRSAYCSVR